METHAFKKYSIVTSLLDSTVVRFVFLSVVASVLLLTFCSITSAATLDLVNPKFDDGYYVDGSGNTVPQGWIFEVKQATDTCIVTCDVIDFENDPHVLLRIADENPTTQNKRVECWLYPDDSVYYDVVVSNEVQHYASVAGILQATRAYTSSLSGEAWFDWVQYTLDGDFDSRWRGKVNLESAAQSGKKLIISNGSNPRFTSQEITGLTGRMKPVICLYATYKGVPYDVFLEVFSVQATTLGGIGLPPPPAD